MNFSMFFEFPGILIVIGVLLIILSIIIGIFVTTDDNKVETNDYKEEDDYNVEVVKLVDDEPTKIFNKKEEDSTNLIKENIVPQEVVSEAVVEDVPVDTAVEEKEDNFLDTEEFVILDKKEENDNSDIETL